MSELEKAKRLIDEMLYAHWHSEICFASGEFETGDESEKECKSKREALEALIAGLESEIEYWKGE